MIQFLQQQCEMIRVVITPGNPVTAMERGELDLALLKREIGAGGAIASWPERLHWVASKQYPIDHRRDPLPLVMPAKLQRELFDTAGSMGEIIGTGELRSRIARFLHKHKDDSGSGREGSGH